MWECKQCGYKNNNSSKTCHRQNCGGLRGKDQEKRTETKQVIDFCPKCQKETVFIFDRKKMVEVETQGLDGGKRVKTIVQKRYNCTECNSLCFQTGKSKPVPEAVNV